MRHLCIKKESWPLRHSFNIARGNKTAADVIHVSISQCRHTGHAESVPYARYGETPDTVVSQIEQVRKELESGLSSSHLAGIMPAGAARNALDCALWDLECQIDKQSAWQRAGLEPPDKLITAFTISLDKPEIMARKASEAVHFPLLKLKLGAQDELDHIRLKAIRAACPNSRLIVDANEGWHQDNLTSLLNTCREYNIELVEQPLPASDDGALSQIEHLVPICADEAVHTDFKLHELRTRYDWVNIKLDKTGGLTEGLHTIERAKQLGFGIMVGCMVGTSLAMAPALILAQQADMVDLDGPLWLEQDRSKGISYQDGHITDFQPRLWGNIAK